MVAPTPLVRRYDHESFIVQHEINSLFENRLDIKTESGIKIDNVRAHSAFTAFFLKLFGKIVELDAYDAVHHEKKIYYVNKNSFLEKSGTKISDSSMSDEKILSNVKRNVEDLKLSREYDHLNDLEFIHTIDKDTIENIIAADPKSRYVTDLKQFLRTNEMDEATVKYLRDQVKQRLTKRANLV